MLVSIGRCKRIELNGDNAREVSASNDLKTRIWELLSKLFWVFDVKASNARPRHLGEKVAIYQLKSLNIIRDYTL
ncbi:hypothetical protein JWG42_13185 [Desulfoprunum benzoelyticum]|uniref:Vancomycin permeability regulator SanA n=1 Tax=Desulfoprunum benzoelyticum TaxID=1506996 RepID=A0A840URX4_9BACT|nr:hypothetical protein [Desulfoprunum benzoelyticum]MBB5347576.1 vancomycin permeability regulator SanA [Desulfoprunum benzoelyticum]MBM9531106.1 hypothetical protein [Desulfoprunum benzoelyticum]